MSEIRLVQETDLPHLKLVLDSIDLFPSVMLDDMISDYLHNQESQDLWFTATEKDTPIALGYCAPEQLTEGTYNLYAIGIKSDIQGKGVGSQLMAYIEAHLKGAGHRLLIVDTSGTEAYKQTREFYEKLGYTKEAVIRDFWKEGDDKVIFSKRLNG